MNFLSCTGALKNTVNSFLIDKYRVTNLLSLSHTHAHTHTHSRMHHALRPLRRQQWHQWSDRWILPSCDFHLSDKCHIKPKHKSKTQVWGICQFDRTSQMPPHSSAAKMLIHRLGMRVLTGAVKVFGLSGLETNRLNSCVWFMLLLLLS